MRPGVTSNLMAGSVHLLDDSGPFSGGIVNSTLAVVDTSNKEGSLHLVLFEKIKNIVSIDVWTVIISDGNGAGLSARVDAATTILNIAKLGTSNIACAITAGNLRIN